MKHEYQVRILVTKTYRVFVEAESFEEAEELAERMLLDGDLDENYSRTDIEAERTCAYDEDDE